jgi:hypothetical protein
MKQNQRENGRLRRTDGPTEKVARSAKQDLPCQMGSPISKHSVRSHATGSCRFWLKSSCGSKESSCDKLPSREKTNSKTIDRKVP